MLEENKKDLKLPNIKFHDLRHTYVTLLLKAISELLGHTSEIITYDVYIDKDEIIYDCLDVLEDFIDEVINKEYNYGVIFIHTDLYLDTHFSHFLKEELLIYFKADVLFICKKNVKIYKEISCSII